MTDDLRRRLEALADRGEPRGADAVLAAARGQAASGRGPGARPPLFVAAALAAALLAVVGTTAAVVHDEGGGWHEEVTAELRDGNSSDNFASGDNGAPTTPPTTAPTTEASPPTADLRQVRLVAYSSCRSLVSRTKREALAAVTPYGIPVPYVMGGGGTTSRRLARGSEVATDDAATAGDAPAASSGGGTGGPAYSETNVQEAGIDEPDVVDTDGRRLFTLRGERLWYATVEGARVRIETSIEVPGAREFVLVGNRAVVFADRFDGGSPTSRLTVVDVTTPQMGVVASLVFEGMHVSGRVVDGVVRAVVRSDLPPLDWRYPADDSPQAQERALAENRNLIRQSDADHWVPSLVVEDGVGRVRADRPLIDCDDTYRPQQFSGFGLLTVVTLDPADPDATTSTSVQADARTVYASAGRLYVSTSEWNPAPERVRSPAETLVHSFDITGRKQARYTGSGRVPGTTIGQFAFSEHDGHLRVASTVQPVDGTPSESMVTVLRETAAGLEQVGHVGGLGRTEQIYAVRFIGPVGYVVTFRRTDPLYVVDLADPRAPRVAGELKIPGYSAYLHPIGPGLLLGVGQDADENGRVKGLQVSVFDVSNPAAPERLHQHAFDGFSGSDVELDHHAFLWWAPTELAVLPLSAWDPQTGQARGSAVGLLADRERLAEVARVSHPDNAAIERSVVIGSTLFTVSRAGILPAALANLAPGEWSPYPG